MGLMTVFSTPPRIQRGAALVIALVFLIALTLLGLASMGGNVLQQRMTYSISETNLAFQGAETAVASGENWIEGQALVPNIDCNESFRTDCGTISLSIWDRRTGEAAADGPNLANLRDAAWWETRGRPVGWNYSLVGTNTVIEAIAGQQYLVAGEDVAGPGGSVDKKNYPHYVIEFLGRDPEGSVRLGETGPRLHFFQVSGRGGGVLEGSPQTITQSVYSKFY